MLELEIQNFKREMQGLAQEKTQKIRECDLLKLSQAEETEKQARQIKELQ